MGKSRGLDGAAICTRGRQTWRAMRALVDGLLRVTARQIEEGTVEETKKASRSLVTPSLLQRILVGRAGLESVTNGLKVAGAG